MSTYFESPESASLSPNALDARQTASDVRPSSGEDVPAFVLEQRRDMAVSMLACFAAACLEFEHTAIVCLLGYAASKAAGVRCSVSFLQK